MGKTARKQNLREVRNTGHRFTQITHLLIYLRAFTVKVAMLSLNNITDSTMDVSDAFSKLREQILAYDNPESDIERTGGLNLVNATNLSYFQASQKSEVFRLKARFLESLGGRSKANRAYCHAVQICPSYARAWASWGGLCSSLGRLAERHHIEASKSSESESQEVGLGILK
jgi:transformation/transcription domain-associated protein